MDGHTEERGERREMGEGSPSVLLTMRRPTQSYHVLQRGSPKETLGSYPSKV